MGPGHVLGDEIRLKTDWAAERRWNYAKVRLRSTLRLRKMEQIAVDMSPGKGERSEVASPRLTHSVWIYCLNFPRLQSLQSIHFSSHDFVVIPVSSRNATETNADDDNERQHPNGHDMPVVQSFIIHSFNRPQPKPIPHIVAARWIRYNHYNCH